MDTGWTCVGGGASGGDNRPRRIPGGAILCRAIIVPLWGAVPPDYFDACACPAEGTGCYTAPSEVSKGVRHKANC